jgi:hypothetical protein
MYKVLYLAVLFLLTTGIASAQDKDNRDLFNLIKPPVQVQQKKSFNDLVDLVKRVDGLDNRLKALEDILKVRTTKAGKEFIGEDGIWRKKAEDNGPDWTWNGLHWYRDVVRPSSSITVPVPSIMPQFIPTLPAAGMNLLPPVMGVGGFTGRGCVGGR